MKIIQLTDREHEMLGKLLEGEIEDIKQNGSKDPFHTTDIVNIFKKLAEPKSQPLVAQPLVVHGAPQETETPKPPIQPEVKEQQLKPVQVEPNLVKAMQLPNVDPSNIDTMADALLPDDNAEELNIEKPQVTK